MPSNSDLKRWYKVFKVKDRDFVRYDKNFRILCFDAINDFHAVNLGQMNEAIQKAIQSHAYDVKVKKIDFPYGELTNLTYDTDDGLSMFGTTRLTEIDDETVDIETTRSIPLRAIDGLSMDVSEDGKHIEISGKEKSNATNLENGTGIGSLVQKTISSSGTPYDNEASGSGAVVFGKDTKAKGNCAFTIGQVNTGDGDGGFVFGNSNHNYTGGDYAILGGFNNENKGADAVVLGRDNKNGDSNYAFILGLSNQISDNCYESGALGSSNKITSQKSIALGLANNLVHERTYAIGNGLKSTNVGQLLLGRFNSNDKEGLIVIGCGDDDNNRDTAAVLVKNGTNQYEFRLYKDVIMTYNNLSAQNILAQNISAKYIDASSGIYLKHKLVSTVSNLDNGVGTGSVAQSGNTAGGTKSAAFGDNTNANRYAQTVVGKYNLDNDEVNTARFVVGNGSAQQRSNAFVVLDDGRAKVQSAPIDNDDVVRKEELDTKLDKAGGTISGSLIIAENLTVQGKTTSVDTQNLKVADKLIYVAKDNTAALTSPAGIITPKYDGTNNGGIVYDSTGTAYVGDVALDSNGNVDTNNSDLQPIATRDTTITDGNIVKWNNAAKKLIDSGKAVNDLSTATNIANGTGDVLVQTTDSNQSFKVMTDGRAKVQAAPVDNDDVLRLNELSVLTQSQVDLLF